MDRANRITILSQMNNLRRLPAFQPETPTTKRYHEAWRQKSASAEDRILEIAELAYILHEDGFPAPEIFKRVGSVYGPARLLKRDRWTDPLRCYLVDHLRTHDAAYVELGASLLNAALALARLWAEIFAQQLTSSNWPPSDMLTEREENGFDALDDFLEGASARDVRRLKARAIPGDELHGYNTGTLSWKAMMGSAGFALVRGGKSIDHIETMMN